MAPEGDRNGAEVTSSGKLFQTLASAIGKARLYPQLADWRTEERQADQPQIAAFVG